MSKSAGSRNGGEVDAIGEALRERGDEIEAAPLARSFYAWYWPLMSPPSEA